MSNYTKTTDFEAKDGLPSGDSGKIIKGAEFETEFDNIATAIATKSDTAGPTFTGTLTFATISDGTINVTAFVDEDNMSSDSATLIPTQQSVKAYVDSQAGDMQFILEDGDGTEVQITKDKEVKFVEGGGIDIDWTDTDNGTDGDPYDLTFTINAAQTGITSLLATDIKIGEDDQTKIDFETADEIHFYAANVEQVYLGDNIFGPQSDSDVDLGSTSVRWKDAYVDSITVTGEIDGNSLDIEGDADINGTLEADAITVDGTALATYIRDTVGTNMLSSNTESGITVTYDTSNDNIDFAIDAAQTGITSLLATDIKIGEDDQTKIDFEDADKINFYAGNEKQLILEDGALYPGSNNIIDLGKSDNEFKHAFFDGTVTADGFAGPLTGDVTGNVSGTAATVTGSAQSSITSLGTLTTLTVDNVIINGTTIGHTGDTDLMTVASGVLTVAGEVSMTTLDIGGTNVTSTAAELNKLDGVGTLKQAGLETIYVPASAMYPNTTAGCAELAQVELSNGPELKCLDFDASSDENAQFTVCFPKSWNEGTVTFQAFWTVTGTNTGTVAWGLSGGSIADDASINTAFGTNVVATAKAFSGTSNDMTVSATSGAVTIANAAADTMTYFQVMRDVSADSQTGDARLLGIKLYFTTDAANDA
tara:strand:+ start:1042 stop:2991 length:1950 start_codon:yes stop_codon:yes gene_type:complete